MTKFYRDQKVELFYFTNPLCFHCWSHEPHLNRFLQIYDDYLDLHIIMGSAEDFQGSLSGEFKNEKLKEAHSLLPSKAFRVFSAVAPEKSLSFLRLMRSSFFTEQIDLSDENNLKGLIQSLGERGGDIIESCKNGEGERRLQEDLRLGNRFTITKIPSLVMVHDGKIQTAMGELECDALRDQLSLLLGFEPAQCKLRSLKEELKLAGRLYPRELEVLYNLNEDEIFRYVDELLEKESYRWVKYDGGSYLEGTHA
ncbi:MAG: hypothetical protein GX046_02225 [Tissierellia bacterium]|nr:hypothetical protein [Tissierellia bacterium]